MIELSIIVFWIVFAVYGGMTEAMFFHVRDVNKEWNTKYDVHFYLNNYRVAVMSIASLAFLSVQECSTTGLLWSIELGFGLSFLFPFFHDGAYYMWRNKLFSRSMDDKGIDHTTLYPLGWMDHSSTSTAFWTKHMTFRNRTLLAIVGIILIITYHIFK